MTIPRRSFLRGAVAASSAAALSTAPARAAARAHAASPAADSAPGPARASERKRARFGLRYAPHFGMFKAHAGDGLEDQLRFMADEGFDALEDNWMSRREPALQESIAGWMDELGMAMGVFVAHAEFGKPTFVEPPEKVRERIESDMRTAVEVAKRVQARWCTVVPGAVRNDVPLEYQTAHVIDNLRFAAEILESAGLCAVLEPLNPWVNHPGLVLTGIPQAYMICRGVDSPSVKILDDLYHQQITEGNLIGNLDRAWSEIAYIQVGDHPGRKEPGTGEIGYRNVFRHLKRKGFDGIVGMEHGNRSGGKDGERAVIDAYVAADR
ncbi:MAG: TIM barrel protein [Planctomycetota bacterium]